MVRRSHFTHTHSPMARTKDKQMETLKRENASLENRIKILMKIVNKLTK